MNVEDMDLWERAKKALSAAQIIVRQDPDSSASRSYYAAFAVFVPTQLINAESLFSGQGF
jgi:uncharacterized protein (UPF0332 family)